MAAPRRAIVTTIPEHPGTAFQRVVWKVLMQIPKGNVTTYGAIARYLGSDAVRAVGSAVGKNPYAPDVPCHRVVRSDGSIGEYSGKVGKAGKMRLLESEGIGIVNGKVDGMESVFFDAFRQV